MADKAVAVQVPVAAKKKHRSPAYPAISLAQAIKRADEFYKKEGRNPASFNAAAAHWEYSPTSSGALVTLAALKSFGLVNEVESQHGRTLQLSPLGLKIVADKRPESQERGTAIKEAALKPKIYLTIWRKYNGSLPSDAELEYRLENELSFNRNSIKNFIKDLRETISFAKLNESDKVSEGAEDTIEESGQPAPKIGDYVQWESQGMIQFREPKRVSGISDDGNFVFVEGGSTGIPIDEATVEESPASAPKPLVIAPVRREAPRTAWSTNMRQDVFSLAEGEVTLSWPSQLSQDSITDLKDWLKIVERKIARSLVVKDEAEAQPTE